MDGYAIVDVGGQQCKVMPDIAFRVPRLDADVGSKVSLDRVLLVSDGKKIAVGQPYLEGKTIECEILRHGRDRKIIVFKKKRRKKYRRTRGHRQHFTEVVARRL
jgi:large subunit ribosomal protein L21